MARKKPKVSDKIEDFVGEVKAPPVVWQDLRPTAKMMTVELHYARANHHHLDHVFYISKGVNHVPAIVWDKVKSHPAILAMIKSGDLVVASDSAQVG